MGWPFMDDSGPGPGFFPVFYGIALIIGSLALVVITLRKGGDPEAATVDWRGVRRALGMWVVFALSIPAMKYLGFALAFAGLIVFFTQVVFRQSWRFTGISAVLLPLGFEILFPLLLGVQLPVGLWTGF